MYSFDIQSLFTNILLKLTLELLIQHVFLYNRTFHGLDKDTFSLLLNLVTLDTFFIFNQTIFKQLDSFAMGLLISLLIT